MRHISTTPFGRRTAAAALQAREAVATAPACPSPGADKWSILRELTEGREAFGLTDRNLSVLSALLSFHPTRELHSGALRVFPSNASLSARLHGMPESTLRRHLATLVNAGMILRHDSPNGKRYVTRNRQGHIDSVFGFDLHPLLLRAAEISEAAEAARQTQYLIRRARQTVILLMRDAGMMLELVEDGSQLEISSCRERLDALKPLLRRKLDLHALSDLEAALRKLLAEMRSSAPEPCGMSANDIQNERHPHNTDSDNLESESAEEPGMDLPPLPLVLKAAPDIEGYAPDPVRDWRGLTSLADFIRPMMGITLETWQFARHNLGERTASVALACILQRFQQIRNPGAYLRRLSLMDNFRVGPMVLSLLRSSEKAGNGVDSCQLHVEQYAWAG